MSPMPVLCGGGTYGNSELTLVAHQGLVGFARILKQYDVVLGPVDVDDRISVGEICIHEIDIGNNNNSVCRNIDQPFDTHRWIIFTKTDFARTGPYRYQCLT